MVRKAFSFRSVLFLLACVLAAGCSESTEPIEEFGASPETELTSGPVESDTTAFRVHFYWSGSDRDGEVIRYRFAVDADTARPVAEWRATTAKDTTLTFPVDPVTAIRRHVFMIAAEDNEGHLDRTPARRFFSSSTIRPASCITRGPGAGVVVPTSFTFEWSGQDPDGGVDGSGGPPAGFEYLLLQIGTLADSSDGSHEPLPPYSQSVYVDLISSSVGDSLPAPYGDWKWIPVQGNIRHFQNIAPGAYVFVIRAVDEAGAREQGIEVGCNLRQFAVSTRVTGPALTVCTSIVPRCLAPSRGPSDFDRLPLEALEGSTASFSWIASAESYGGAVSGYAYALDDTTQLTAFDPLRTGVTFLPQLLPAGMHHLYVRVIDDGGSVTNAVIPLWIIRPAFQDPANGRQVLYVDDSTAPGVRFPSQDATTSIGNFPNDVVETSWWTLELLSGLGVPVTEWDALLAGAMELQQRMPPPLRTLANYSTVVWNVDFNNDLTSPTALWRTLVGDGEWALRNYLRAGGTLILSGFDVSSNTVNPRSIFDALSGELCAATEPGTAMYEFTYFPRTLMGVDGVVVGKESRRTFGARDFIAAYPSTAGGTMGFDSARVDRGPEGSGAKWITESLGEPETSLAPGLPRVDGWAMASNFNCALNPGVFRVENPAQPVAEPILRYHGVNKGVNEDGGPSPRENLVVGIRVQAHDEGETAGSDTPYGSGPLLLTPGNARGAYGRMVHFSFPFYFLRDEDALQTMRAAFQYVNASPTLP